jgi:hypothetical protein
MEDEKSSDRGRPNPPPLFPPLVASGQANQLATESTYPVLASFPERVTMAQLVRHRSPTIGPLPLPRLEEAPRRIIAPISPRAVTLSGASLRTADVLHDPLPSQPTSFPGSVLSQYVSHQGGPGFAGGLPQIQSLVSHGSTVPPPPLSPGLLRSASHSGPGRLIPQSMLTKPPRPAIGIPNPGLPQPPRPLQRLPPLPPAAQDVLPAGQQNERAWGGAITGSVPMRGWPRGLSLGEAQPIFAITPQPGEEILIPVDTYQGSKSADERRLRNAGASNYVQWI